MQPSSIPLDERMQLSPSRRPPTPETPSRGRVSPTESSSSRARSSARDRDSLRRTHPLVGEESSDELDGPIVQIEEFRGGFPKPLPRNPIRLQAVGSHGRTALWQNCKDNVVELCEEMEIDIAEIGVYMLQGAKNTFPAPTIQIIVFDNQQRPQWNSILVLTWHILRNKGALDLNVLIKCDIISDAHIFPIEFDNPLVTLWPKKLLGSVISIIDSYRLDFGALEVFKYGTELGKSTPTILITVEDEDENRSTWSKAQTEITNLCRSEGYDLPVVLKEGCCTFAKLQTHTATRGIENAVYSHQVYMGHSIAVESEGAGTLGGYLRLQDRTTGRVQIVGLVNYHVVRGSSQDWPTGKSCSSFDIGLDSLTIGY